MKKRYALLIPAITAMFGCASQAPVAENFPLSYQKVARTAHHWDVVADDVVSQTLETIAEKKQLQGRGIYVAPARNTAFNGAFRDFLITRFVDHGASVAACKVDQHKPGFAMDGPDIEVNYETQVIGHADTPAPYQPGVLTALAAGVVVLHNVGGPLTHLQTDAAILGTGALLDWGAGHIAKPTRTEVIVTTTIVENNRFVLRRSDVYYVPDGDANLFFQRIARRSPCPGEKMAMEDSIPAIDDASSEAARRAQVARDMRRVNPEWREKPASTSPAYSY